MQQPDFAAAAQYAIARLEQELDPRLNQHIQHMMDLPYERVLKAAKRLLAERAA